MELLSHCRDLALPFYGDLLKSSQETLRQRLFEQAEKSTSNEDQRCYYEAIQVLNGAAVPMLNSFKNDLLHNYQQFLSGHEVAPAAMPSGQGGLQLLAREQLEDELAVSMIVSRAATQHAEALWKLNRRLAVLRGGKKVNDDNNPFGPASVCQALRTGMQQVDCELKARIFIYKHLGKLLLAAFGKLFATLNDTLATGGVLPNLKFSLNKAADAATDAAAEIPMPAPPPTPASAAGSGIDQHQLYTEVLAALRARQPFNGRYETASGVSYRGLETGKDGAVENFLPMDYALVLSALQQAPEFNSTTSLQQPLKIDAVEAQLFGHLKQQAKADARHKLAAKDADTVDLVGMIFRYMLDDAKVPDLVKSLLSHLHTPYLKLALLDPTFLDDQQHPARLLLNQMAETGTRWIADEKDRTALPKLKTVVDTILRGFIDDVTLFDRLLEDFSRFREGLEKRAEMVERRNREAQEGIERLSGAKQRATAEIQERIKGFSLPTGLQQLLEKPWTDFLAFNYLRNGEQSLSWKAALKVVDGMLWSVQSGGSRSRDEFQRHQQQLEQSIAEGLRTIGYDSESGQELLRALREAQEMAFRGEPIATPPAPVEVKPQPKPEPVANQFSPEEQEIADMLRTKVEFGTWFEFDRPGQKSLLVKLAWFSRASGHYMFVTPAGIKHAVETLPSLVHGLHAGTIRIGQPEKRSFMERAFSAILHTLRLDREDEKDEKTAAKK